MGVAHVWDVDVFDPCVDVLGHGVCVSPWEGVLGGRASEFAKSGVLHAAGVVVVPWV